MHDRVRAGLPDLRHAGASLYLLPVLIMTTQHLPDAKARPEMTPPPGAREKPDPAEQPFRFASETLRLRMRDWLVVLVLVILATLLLPRVWTLVDDFETGENFRFPYDLSNDYWLVSRWIGEATATYPALTLGDSVVWGQYAGRNETLAAYLNAGMGEQVFGNIGLDGLHPAAMYGLVRHYGGSIRNKQVLIQLNPLWVSSAQHDLQGDEETRFNHPGLVPQVYPNLPVYKPTVEEVFFTVLERSVDFFAWTRHLRLAYFDNMDYHSWTLENPSDFPLSFIGHELPAVDENPRSRAIPWEQGGFTETEFPWLDLETSFQWQSFRNMIDLLRSRDNEVFVLVGPFNKHMMAPESRVRYEQVKAEMVRWLEQEGIPHNATANLPTDEFGDASHPLASGYERLARELLEDPAFFK
ncbi:hypothetical protein ACERK3_17495 [Phycisphaerales bacterium AB-hyl4]|uniref:SGNH/GDSL hydrolase family protein n=1 Tax=Natronomicrosphaera hydrolytica TaxID=3242702 RepID=A0ABV4UAY9_9BACT